VECLAGQRYPERPLRFEWLGQFHDVVKVISEAHTPQGYAFTVMDGDQNQFLLEYNESKQVWTVNPWN
jgi:hypothetical protein